MRYIFTSHEEVEKVRKRINENPVLKCELKLLGELYAERTEYSVTYNRAERTSGGIHDYFSEGPYWHPDPENPSGPFIRRDGEFYEERFTAHHDDFLNLCETVYGLAMAGFYLEKEEYSKRAIHLIKVWFIDEDTKMNPNLDYAQAIRGVCSGRGIGIIDFVPLIKLLHSCQFLSGRVIDELKRWLEIFLDWMLTSDNGKEERNKENNHYTWYNAIVLSIASFIGRDDIVLEFLEEYKINVVQRQLSSDGGFTDELTRTNAFTYTLFNLDAAAVVCEIAWHRGIDLWSFEIEGKSIKKAVEFLIPYMKNPYLWKYSQISGEIPDESYGFEMASRRLSISDAAYANKLRGKDKYLLRQQKPLGAITLL